MRGHFSALLLELSPHGLIGLLLRGLLRLIADSKKDVNGWVARLNVLCLCATADGKKAVNVCAAVLWVLVAHYFAPHVQPNFLAVFAATDARCFGSVMSGLTASIKIRCV